MYGILLLLWAKKEKKKEKKIVLLPAIRTKAHFTLRVRANV
jgi:hypothetical protein